jgi:hypothetical protein
MAKTEDQVRGAAEKTLGFDDGENGVKQGTGQITTFNQLGFKGKNDKPDGWYLPDDTSKVAIVLEAKAEGVDIEKQPYANELLKNIAIIHKKYARVIGILYNGTSTRVWKNDVEVSTSVSPDLERKDYYTERAIYSSIPARAI